MIRHIATMSLALIIALAGLQYGPPLVGLESHGFVGPAEARVGRPLTPVSVAGVGRRTVRRCAAGVYHC